jgi:hypothetical protein
MGMGSHSAPARADPFDRALELKLKIWQWTSMNLTITRRTVCRLKAKAARLMKSKKALSFQWQSFK